MPHFPSMSNGFIYVVDAHFIDKIEKKYPGPTCLHCMSFMIHICQAAVTWQSWLSYLISYFSLSWIPDYSKFCNDSVNLDSTVSVLFASIFYALWFNYSFVYCFFTKWLTIINIQCKHKHILFKKEDPSL
jgi:hypothetical protein